MQQQIFNEAALAEVSLLALGLQNKTLTDAVDFLNQTLQDEEVCIVLMLSRTTDIYANWQCQPSSIQGKLAQLQQHTCNARIERLELQVESVNMGLVQLLSACFLRAFSAACKGLDEHMSMPLPKPTGLL